MKMSKVQMFTCDHVVRLRGREMCKKHQIPCFGYDNCVNCVKVECFFTFVGERRRLYKVRPNGSKELL